MALGSVQLNGDQNFVLYLDAYQSSTSGNSSIITYSLYIDPPGNWAAYSLTLASNSYSITIGGQVLSGNFTYDFRSPNGNVNKVVRSGTVTVGHDGNGYANVTATGSVNTANSAVGDGTVAAFFVPTTDFDYKPTGAWTSVGGRYNDGQTVGLTFGADTSGRPGIDAFQFMWRYSWTGWQQTIDSGSTYQFGTDAGNTYYFVSRAHNSDGWSDWSGEAVSWGYGVAGQPSPPSLSASNNGVTVNVTTYQGDGAGLSILENQWAWSYDNSSWNYFGGVGATSFVRTNTDDVYVISRSRNRVGWGAWSGTSYLAGVPSVPASIGLVRNARSVTVTVGASVSNNGSTISGYFVQYSLDGGVSWSAGQVVSGGVYTYVNLLGGKTYVFRAWSVNGIGSSGFVSSTIFVPAGGKRWDGSGFVSTATAKRWSGSGWVALETAKRWTGAAWVDLS